MPTKANHTEHEDDRICIRRDRLEQLHKAERELAQIKAEAKPEPEFWPGEIVEVRDNEIQNWTVRKLEQVYEGSFLVQSQRGGPIGWDQCRKLTDSHVLQFRPLADGERLPGGEWNVLFKNGRSQAVVHPIRYSGDGIIGYAPVKPVREEE
jgi:hypothetical protein